MAETSDIQESADNLPAEQLQGLIKNIRGQQVMLDRDLAALYGVETKQLNRQVKRNIERFPEDFMFQLCKEECLRYQIGTLNGGRGQHLKYMPYAFTENGVAMLSSVLRSKTAIDVNIRIMRAFTAMRHFLASNEAVVRRLETIEFHQLEMQHKVQAVEQNQQATQDRLDDLFRRFDTGDIQPKQGVFYDGQLYDAYTFIAALVKEAKEDITLIDNYVDETVLTLLDKRAEGVVATIYTRSITRQLQNDIDHHNAQYPPIEVRTFSRAHDRFLCIDQTVYHIGASIKDLGKRWTAFSRMEALTSDELLGQL